MKTNTMKVGRPRVAVKMVRQINVRFGPDYARKLRWYADEVRLPVGTVIRNVMCDFLDEQYKRKE